jgi:hypothetical protein
MESFLGVKSIPGYLMGCHQDISAFLVYQHVLSYIYGRMVVDGVKKDLTGLSHCGSASKPLPNISVWRWKFCTF